MGLISREGTFRGVATDSGVALSSGGFPQFVANITVTEIYDFDEKEWVDWSGQDEEITAYLVLFGGNGKPTLTAKQLQKALGWSGQSFQELNDANYEAVPFQFRVEENEYNDKVTLQVSWIDAYDAVPGRQVQKLDAADIKKLDKLFATQLKGFGGTKVASAPATGKPSVPVESNAAGTDPEETVQAEPEIPLKTTKGKTKKDAKTALPAGTCTKSEAWRSLIGLIEDCQPKMPDEQRAGIFTDAMQKIAPAAKSKAEVTPEQWFEIKEECTTTVLKF